MTLREFDHVGNRREKKKSFSRKIQDAHNIALKKNVFTTNGLFIHPFLIYAVFH